MQVEDVAERFNLDTVRVLTSGELDESMRDWLGTATLNAVVHEAYGQTEVNVVVGQCTSLLEPCDGSVGKPGPGHTVCIVDPDTGAPVEEPDTVGEIAVAVEGDPV